MLPLLLRPDCFGRCLVSFRSGVARVTSSKLLTDMNRRPGLVGLYFLTGTTLSPTWCGAVHFRPALCQRLRRLGHGHESTPSPCSALPRSGRSERRGDYTPSNSPSIFWPGASVTIAFFHDGL